MPADQAPTLIETRFMFQAPPDHEDRRLMFYVRVIPDGKQIQRLIDIPTTTGSDVAEGLREAFLAQIRSAIDAVKRVKLPPMREQEG